MKSRKWLLRISILVVIISVFFSLAVSSNALELKANSYIEKITEYDGGVVLNYRFLATQAYVFVYDASSNYSIIYRGSGAYHDIGFVPGHTYRISIWAFGYPGGSSGLLVDSLPPSASMSLSYGFVYDTDDTGYATTITPAGTAYYFAKGAEGFDSHISAAALIFEGQNGRTNVSTQSFNFDPPANSHVLNFEFQFNNVSWESDPVPTGIVLSDIKIRANVDESFIQGEYWEWTNSVLQDIYGSINSPVSPTPPPNIDSIQDVEDLDDNVIDFVDDNWDALDNIFANLPSIFSEIGPALLFISWIIDLFVEISFFSKLINIVMSLGITAFVLNLILTVVTRSRSENGKSKETKDKGGGT